MKEIIISHKTIFEYTILFITISLFVTSSYFLLGGKFKDTISRSTCKLTDGIYIEGEHIGEGYCSSK